MTNPNNVELNAEQLTELGREVVNSFHLIETKGKYLTEAGYRSLGEIGMMTCLLVDIAKIKANEAIK